MTTVAQIQDMIANLTRDQNYSSTGTKAQVSFDVINTCLRKITDSHNWYWQIKENTFTTSSQTYTFPNNVSKIYQDLEIQSKDTAVKEISIDDALLLSKSSSAKGIPCYYYKTQFFKLGTSESSNTPIIIKFDREPDSSYTFNYYYYYSVNPFSVNTETVENKLPIVEVLKYNSASMLKSINDEDGSTLFLFYQELLKSAKKEDEEAWARFTTFGKKPHKVVNYFDSPFYSWEELIG
ncbi:MAG: hypothetical protein ACOYWZ_11110 [Bacillota bacterium]